MHTTDVELTPSYLWKQPPVANSSLLICHVIKGGSKWVEKGFKDKHCVHVSSELLQRDGGR